MSYALEKQVAISAVTRACSVTSAVFNRLVNSETTTKEDQSPVTVADYAAQAVISTILARVFPEDALVGEEDATALREPREPHEAAPAPAPAPVPATEKGTGTGTGTGTGKGAGALALRERITALANEALRGALRPGERAAWGIGPGAGTCTTEEVLRALDRGAHAGGATGRVWTVDPVDGTKGFLRGGQYAVCLALIVDAQVQVGVMGCPNMPRAFDGDGDGGGGDGDGGDAGPGGEEEERGVLFVAVRGQGAEQRTGTWTETGTDAGAGARPTLLKIPPVVPRRLLESYEAGHSSRAMSERVSQILGITEPPLRMDSQVKYGALARGEGMAYFRMPTGVGYREKIWDHASGSLIVSEAGGLVTDSRGRPLDFGLGRTLGENYGVIGAGRDVHGSILEAVQKAQLIIGE